MNHRDYKILSVYSHKGGVGKTTLVDVIGGFVLNRQNNDNPLIYKRCLLIDLDTQMNLTCKILQTEDRFQDYFDSLADINNFDANISNQDIKTKLTRLLNFQTRNHINPNPIPILEDAISGRRVDLIPGYPELQQLSKQMALELDQPNTPLNTCEALRNLIDEYVNQFQYDLIVLDLGPDLYTINSCALWSSDYVLIPCTADMYSAMSFRLIANTIFPRSLDPALEPNHGFNRFRSKLSVLGFVPNRVKMSNNMPTQAQQRGINRLQQKFAEHLGPHFEKLSHFECAPGTNPCNILLIGRDIVDHEAQSLLELPIADPTARARLREQLDKMVRWLNRTLT